jgi:hypothetical protein
LNRWALVNNECVVWFVIGMALVCDHSVLKVVRHLDLVLPRASGRRRVSGTTASDTARRIRSSSRPRGEVTVSITSP